VCVTLIQHYREKTSDVWDLLKIVRLVPRDESRGQLTRRAAFKCNSFTHTVKLSHMWTTHIRDG